MPQIYSNDARIPLALAVFLATDDYDYESGVISATSLLKPVRQLVLSKRVDGNAPIDISGLVASRMGSAIHAAIEKSWTGATLIKALQSLGYPNKVINNIVVNPEPDHLQANPDAIPVYMEKRSYKQIGKYRVSGKFDFVAEGTVQDFKSTSVYNYINQSSVDKYVLQGSIYRWLNQDIITKDVMMIHYVFTDWSKASAMQDKNYPQNRVLTQRLPLLSLEATENFVKSKLTLLSTYNDAPENRIPLCEDKDLWRKADVWKYYKDPAKTEGRSTRTYDNQIEAFAHLAKDGHVGLVKHIKGQVVACKYCSAFDACTQKDALIASGELLLT